MTLTQKIRTSFTTQLSLWVAGFVLVTSSLVILLLARFSQDAIHDETIDTTMQALENTALRIDNTLRQAESPRHDSVGRLTNSFILMQQSLARIVNDIRNTNAELSELNSQLTEAYQLKLDTNRRKADFVHYMYHEIRTPLNIISGFAQVLTASRHSLEADEVDDITARMQESANNISRLTRELGETANNHPE